MHAANLAGFSHFLSELDTNLKLKWRSTCKAQNRERNEGVKEGSRLKFSLTGALSVDL